MEEQSENQPKQPIDGMIINEVQLLLAEKRTSLSVMRTGIAVLVLPMSVVSVLIATSKYYDIFNVLYFLIPLFVLNTGLVLLGSYLVIRAVFRMKKYDRHIHEIKLKYSAISEFIE